jgi:hypothetical protein
VFSVKSCEILCNCSYMNENIVLKKEDKLSIIGIFSRVKFGKGVVSRRQSVSIDFAH